MSLQTSAAFRQYYMDGRAPLVRAVLRLADDTTVQVGGDRIMVGGLSVTGATSPASDFSIGSAIVGTATVTLANYDGWLDLLDLEGATLLAYAGAEVAGGTEWALLGTYDVDAPTTRGMTYPLQCRDWMGRFEVAYSEVTTAYPATLATIVSDICSHVGITLATPTFTNSTHVVQARPTDELSCIDMLGFVAQLACSYARMTPDGRLSLGWYDPDAFGGSESWLDGGTFSGSQTPYADGDAANGGAFMTGGDTASGGSFDGPRDYSQVSAIRSLTTGAMDVTITGLRVTAQDEVVTEGEGAEGESYQYGQDGYVLAIEGNPLVPYGSAQSVAAMVAPYVVGLSFRPLDSDVIGDPSLQAGDAMVVTDRTGRTYRTYVTQATWSSGGSQRLACGAQAPSRRAMSRTGVVTRAISSVKGAVRRVTTATKAAGIVANEAKSVAEAIGQHFWTDTDGIHVTEVTRESWEQQPAGHNILINSLGQLLRIGLNNLVSYTQGATTFFDGLGNAASNVVGRYGRDGAMVGYEGGTHAGIEPDRFSIMSGADSLYEVKYEGELVSIYGGGTTHAYGTDYTNAYVEALVRRLNDGYTVDLSTLRVLLPNGLESGMTVVLSSGSIYDVLDADGDEFDSGTYAGILYDSSTGMFGLNVVMYPAAEDPGAPIHEELGGVALDFADSRMSVKGDTSITGSVSVSEGITVANHVGPIGEVVTNNIDTAVSVPDGTWTSIGSVTLSAGVWTLEHHAIFPSNATGRRAIASSTTADSAGNATEQRQGFTSQQATSGTGTGIDASRVLNLTSNATLHLNVYQNSGSSLNVTGFMRAVRIA